ncbi:MAG: AAA family ATPase, partial [Myxococcota bacterium]
HPTEADLWPLVHVVADAAGQRIARDALRDVLAATDSAALPHAAEEASFGPATRARRLIGSANELLAARPGTNELASWRLKLEGIVREIDAGFAPEDRNDDLSSIRTRLVAEIQAPQVEGESTA